MKKLTRRSGEDGPSVGRNTRPVNGLAVVRGEGGGDDARLLEGHQLVMEGIAGGDLGELHLFGGFLAVAALLANISLQS